MNCIILHIPPTLFKIFFLLQPFTMGMCYSIPKCSTITTVTELFPARGPCEALARPASHMPAFRSPDTELFCMAVSTEATKMTFPSGESFQPSGRNVPGKHLVTSYSHHNLRHCLHHFTCAAKGQRLLKTPEFTMPCHEDCLS